MPFCTNCGHDNPAEGAFCDECGRELKRKPGPSAPVARVSSKRLGLIGGGLALLLGVAVGGVFLLGPETASEEVVGKAVQRYVDGKPAFIQPRTCLNNFAYGSDPALVSAYDSNARQWLDVLVTGGLYAPPEKRTSGGWFSQSQYVYQKTPAGVKATAGGRLCFAEGLVVKSVTELTQPQVIEKTSAVRAKVSFDYKAPAAWSQTPAAKELVRQLGEVPHEVFVLALDKDKKWAVSTDITAQALSEQAEQRADSSNDWLGSLRSLFAAFSGNPVLGKWTDGLFSFEFTADTMRTPDGVEPVRYEVAGKKVTIIRLSSGKKPFRVEVLSDDSLRVGQFPFFSNLKRIH